MTTRHQAIRTLYLNLYDIHKNIPVSIKFGDTVIHVTDIDLKYVMITIADSIAHNIYSCYNEFFDNIDYYYDDDVIQNYMMFISNYTKSDAIADICRTDWAQIYYHFQCIIGGCTGKLINPHIRLSALNMLSSSKYITHNADKYTLTRDMAVAIISCFSEVDVLTYMKITNIIDYLSINNALLTLYDKLLFADYQYCYNIFDMTTHLIDYTNDPISKHLHRTLLELACDSMKKYMMGFVAKKMSKDVFLKYNMMCYNIITKYKNTAKKLIDAFVVFYAKQLIQLFKTNRTTPNDFDWNYLIPHLKFPFSYKLLARFKRAIDNKNAIVKMDPVFCVPIVEPCSLPGIDGVYNKSSMIMYLRTNPIDMFTREPLSVEEFESYNNQQDITKKYYNVD